MISKHVNIRLKRTRKLQSTPLGKKWIYLRVYEYMIPSGYSSQLTLEDFNRAIEWIVARNNIVGW